MAHDFETPEGRLGALEFLGAADYAKALKMHQQRAVMRVVNGYPIRAVSSRFGRLYAVDGTKTAFFQIERAADHARELPTRKGGESC